MGVSLAVKLECLGVRALDAQCRMLILDLVIWTVKNRMNSFPCKVDTMMVGATKGLFQVITTVGLDFALIKSCKSGIASQPKQKFLGHSNCILRVLSAVAKHGMSWGGNTNKLDEFHSGSTFPTLSIVVVGGISPIGLLLQLMQLAILAMVTIWVQVSQAKQHNFGCMINSISDTWYLEFRTSQLGIWKGW